MPAARERRTSSQNGRYKLELLCQTNSANPVTDNTGHFNRRRQSIAATGIQCSSVCGTRISSITVCCVRMSLLGLVIIEQPNIIP